MPQFADVRQTKSSRRERRSSTVAHHKKRLSRFPKSWYLLIDHRNHDGEMKRQTTNTIPDELSRHSTTTTAGLGQLSLVEHAFCPLDPAAALRPGQCHSYRYLYSDTSGVQQTATAQLTCPAGLSAMDEFFLWGLLGLTFLAGEGDGELHATPHFCLRQLGLIDQRSRRGGRQYRQFAQSLERLSLVKYRNNGFFDPLRREHRKVSFGFLSYSLPIDPQSSRAWRIVWDSLFLELVRPLGGHLTFDFDLYRELDPASRRLFLLLSKIFRRRATSPLWDLRDLAINTLGFSENVATRDLKVKVGRCVQRLAESNVVDGESSTIQHIGRKQYRLRLQRGQYFDRRKAAGIPRRANRAIYDSAFYEPLRELDFDDRAIARMVTEYEARMLREWLDITLAAKERFGVSFFKRSPAAFLIDNLRHAKQGLRTPPDWWHRLKRKERKASVTQKLGPGSKLVHLGEDWLTADVPQVITHLTAQFSAAGQAPEKAKLNAERIAHELQRRRKSA